ncbi:hypothetical protein CDCA_CDCA03G0989 [Cyanidium caldarium]|uniref:CBM20 domain-containing protein n=1 Tax=Cyanidium caldarium TaxID=2771 RepID=A0AAV9IS43_CYACA|nr:hypothetical protein CDCA_CDCA03G0989 [Cyanidium caldarium]
MRCHVFGEGTEVVEVLADGPVAVPQRALAPSAVTCTLSDERAVASAQLKTKGADGGAAVRCRRLLPDGVPAEVPAVPEAICLVRLSTAGEAPTVRWVQWSVSVGFCGAFGERIREQSGRAVTTLERLARRYAQRWTPKDAQHFLPALDSLHPSPTPAAPLWPQLVKPTERLGPQRETEPTVLSHDPPPLRRNGVHRPSATPSATTPAASAATMHPASPVAPATPSATTPAASAATMHPASPVAPATPPATAPAVSAATMHPASPAALPTSSLPTTSSPTVDKPITHNLPTVSTVANHTRLKFQLHCTPRALQHLADTTHRWVPFVTGNVAELGAWNMNVAKKLDYSADADCFRALVPVHSPHPPGGRLQYAYFLVDDRFGDRCSSRIAFECLAEERAARQPTSAGPSTTGSASEVMPPTIPIRSLKLPPSLPPPPTARTPGRGVIASMPTPAPLTVRDEQVDFGISTGYVRLRVQLPTTSAESLPFADAYRVCVTGDVYQLGMWRQPGLLAMRAAPELDHDTWEITIARPCTPSVEYAFALVCQRSGRVCWERAVTRFAELRPPTAAASLPSTSSAVTELPVATFALQYRWQAVDTAGSVLVGAFIEPADVEREAISIGAETQRPLGAWVVVMPHNRHRCTGPGEAEALERASRRLGARLLLVPIAGDALLERAAAAAAVVSGDSATDWERNRSYLLQAIQTCEHVIRLGHAVYVTSAGSFRYVSVLLDALIRREAITVDAPAVARHHIHHCGMAPADDLPHSFAM